MRTMMRWLNELELDALELTGGTTDPLHMEKARELIRIRVAVLRKVLKDYTCELPETINVKVRVDVF